MNSIWQNTYICKYDFNVCNVQNVNVSKFTSNISNWLFDIVNHKLKQTQFFLALCIQKLSNKKYRVLVNDAKHSKL